MLRQQFQVMSFPKLNDFVGKGKVQYKRVSLIHSIKNCLTRNTIIESCKKPTKPSHNPMQSAPKPHTPANNSQNLSSLSTFKYQQKMPASLTLSTQDLYKLLQHLFNKKQQHDSHDRNFIRRLMLKHFPQELICAGGRDLVSLLKFDKLRKGERKVFDQGFLGSERTQQNSGLNKQSERNFYFILKGNVRVFTEQFTYKRTSGQYFGQLQILCKQKILQIEAKSDTILLYLTQPIFANHLSNYFSVIYQQIRKKISLFEPILNLAPLYNQLKFLQSLYQKQFKTGDKIYQKGEEITEIVFLNHAEISSTQDKLLNEFRAVGLGEVLNIQKPKAKETTYCMDNKTVYVMKASELGSFIDKDTILSYLSQNYNFTTVSRSKLAPNSDQGNIKGANSPKLQTFMNIKRVRFTGNKRRVLTEPNLSISLQSPTSSSKKTPTYPQYATSFVFIKENSSLCFTQMKNRLRTIKGENSRRTDIKEHLLKTRDSFRKKKWLDEIDGGMEGSIIFNPEKMAKYEMGKDEREVREFVLEG